MEGSESREQEGGCLLKDREAVFGDATRRLACVGMDWARVSVKDLFGIFNSVLAHSSSLQSVKLCKTKVGRERLGNDEVFVKRCEDGIEECYVAVAEFQDVEDSKEVYSICDGTKLEDSDLMFDLRFVPDTLELRNVCDEAFSDARGMERKFGHKARRDMEDDTDSEMESKLKKLFEQKEISFDMVSELVDMSEDEEPIATPSSLTPASAKKDEFFGSDCEDSFGEEYKEHKQAEKKKPRKREAKKENIETIPRCKGSDEGDGFVFDPKDERFGALFEDNDFSIDPTHPEYKKKGALKQILDEKRKRFKDDD